MHTKFAVDVSSRFLFRAQTQTHRHTHKVTDATATAGMGNNNHSIISEKVNHFYVNMATKLQAPQNSMSFN